MSNRLDAIQIVCTCLCMFRLFSSLHLGRGVWRFASKAFVGRLCTIILSKRAVIRSSISRTKSHI